jgi:hypothetical protein
MFEYIDINESGHNHFHKITNIQSNHSLETYISEKKGRIKSVDIKSDAANQSAIEPHIAK